MSTIIGLTSGTQLIVSDLSYLFVDNKTQAITRVFLSPDEKRVITIPPDGSIEFFDEPVTGDTIKDLETARLSSLKPTEVSGDIYDPNVR